MMKRFARLALSLLLLGFIPAFAQTMSDAQVLEYVKRAMQQGKGQQEIAVELLSQGVTEEQALLGVKEMYQQQMGSTSTSNRIKHASYYSQPYAPDTRQFNSGSSKQVFATWRKQTCTCQRSERIRLRILRKQRSNFRLGRHFKLS